MSRKGFMRIIQSGLHKSSERTESGGARKGGSADEEREDGEEDEEEGPAWEALIG